MKLESLQLENFRQFAGKQCIEFAGDPARNVTLVYGPNGAGKTTLLNAFIWALYGEFTQDFEQPERLIHAGTWDAAEIGEELSASVELRFDHRDIRYEVVRTLRMRKDSTEQRIIETQGVVQLFITDDEGTKKPENPSDHLARILPRELYKFFFFNGERIENLTRPPAYRELAGATRTLLGLEILSRAINHLPQAAKSFQGELRRLGTPQTEAIGSDIERIETELEQVRAGLTQCEENLNALEQSQRVIWSQLQQHAQGRVLQERRAAAIKRRERALDARQRVRGELRELISARGYQAYCRRVSRRVAERFSALEARGELPPPIKEPFVHQLLERGRCICGAPLTEHSPQRAELEDYLRTAGSPELESRWNQITFQAGRLEQDRGSFAEDLRCRLAELDAALAEQRAAAEEESEAEHGLGGSEDIDIRGLEQRNQQLKEQIREASESRGRLQRELEGLEREDEQRRRKLMEAAEQDERAQDLLRHVKLAEEASSVLERLREVLTEAVRQELDRRIIAAYDRISARARTPELSPKFELRLWEQGADGERRLAPNSTSENTILALSFVGGLVSYARDQERGTMDDEMLERLVRSGIGISPVVIDAAFGSLDVDYKTQVARALPELVPQLVCFLSKSQAQGTVQELESRVGSRYVIVSYVAKEDRDEDLDVDGATVPYRRTCQAGQERAELVEVT